MSEKCPSRDTLNKIFPPEKTDEFFDAMYGEAEEGAYDIRLVCKNIEGKQANLVFQLLRRPGKCLKCSITYGLPEVFMKHKVIDLAGVSNAIARELGWTGKLSWQLGEVMDINEDLQMIPYTLREE